MFRRRSRTYLVICVAILFLLFVYSALPATPPTRTDPVPHNSVLCQMKYVDRLVEGQPVWEVVAMLPGPEGGRLGVFQFRAGDVIVEVGGQAVMPGDNLDMFVRQALKEQARTVTLVEPDTGTAVIYGF
jgi:hypothetical protein